jgi:hypothetical protein
MPHPLKVGSYPIVYECQKAPLVGALLDAAAQLRKHITWTPPSRHLLAKFRAILAVCTNYAFFCRAETGVRCLTHDLTVD